MTLSPQFISRTKTPVHENYIFVSAVPVPPLPDKMLVMEPGLFYLTSGNKMLSLWCLRCMKVGSKPLKGILLSAFSGFFHLYNLPLLIFAFLSNNFAHCYTRQNHKYPKLQKFYCLQNHSTAFPHLTKALPSVAAH